jgi:hypothetical protein
MMLLTATLEQEIWYPGQSEEGQHDEFRVQTLFELFILLAYLLAT